MEYQLSAELTSPPDAPDLDPLQQVGVVALLDSRLNNLISIEGPDGVEITPIEHSIHVHLGGAVVNWLLDAPALVLAEDATRAVLEQILDEMDLLDGWEVKHCAVTATDDQLESALAAGDTEPLPDDALPLEGSAPEHVGERRARLLAAAPQLRAFDLEKLDDLTTEEARYVAGALMHGVEMMIDELFGDIQLLDDEDATADEVEALWILDELPEQYADRYTALFAKQFLVTAAILGYRLAQPGWTPPLCVAEALALHIAKSRAEIELDFADVMNDERIAEVFAAFDGLAFANHDHELLYDPDLPVGAGLTVEDWFRPRSETAGAQALHPYLADEDPPHADSR